MTYDPTSPHAQNSPEMSPSQIQTNFQVFATAEMSNHVAMNNVGFYQGKHTVIVFKNMIANPPSGVNNTFGVLYGRGVAQSSGVSINLFYQTIQFIPNIPNIPQQVTFNVVSMTGYTQPGPNPQYTNMQQSFTFGGFIIYFGQWKFTTAPLQIDVALSGSGIPIPSRLVYARVMGQSSALGISIPLTGSIFFIANPGAAQTVKYFAIGLV